MAPTVSGSDMAPMEFRVVVNGPLCVSHMIHLLAWTMPCLLQNSLRGPGKDTESDSLRCGRTVVTVELGLEWILLSPFGWGAHFVVDLVRVLNAILLTERRPRSGCRTRHPHATAHLRRRSSVMGLSSYRIEDRRYAPMAGPNVQHIERTCTYLSPR
jgi:hypothetical protein